jgi:hypothetical protein
MKFYVISPLVIPYKLQLIFSNFSQKVMACQAVDTHVHMHNTEKIFQSFCKVL